MELLEFLWSRRISFLRSLLLLIWIPNFIKIAESCSTRAAPKIRSPPLLPPASAQQGHNNHSSHINNTVPHFDCPATYQKWYCLNRASCFTVKIGDTILYNCKCTEGYMGQRCEYKDTAENYSEIRTRYMVKRAGIAGGVTAGIMLVIILTIALTLFLRRRREQKQAVMFTAADMRRIPFGRAISRTEHYKVAHQGSLQNPVATTSRIHEIPEQKTALLGKSEKSRIAPVARMSEVSLFNENGTSNDQEVHIRIPDEDAHINLDAAQHPYSFLEPSRDSRPTSSFLNFSTQSRS